ncbi:hypothetical protein B0T20DRAFT_184391 [Sordaria brevicollis]|uniref:Nicotinamide N-methyltransferase n=1 Tax=Sordaria brevicollis TaxID=83679 RepID=A0AAE0PFK1_SORBR|nr:hypothetical protein B0T20DRAFT_184391 [Sordaria brevicollis]
MALTARLSVINTGSENDDPEDLFAGSLGVIFTDDVTNQHGDASTSLHYTSPHLSKPLRIELSDPTVAEDRSLFSHFLWNASLMLADLIEAGTLGLKAGDDATGAGAGTASVGEKVKVPELESYDIKGKSTIEMGAGTGLPSLMAAMLGAKRVLVTDYPAPVVIENLRKNVELNLKDQEAVKGVEVAVEGHGWGELETPLAKENKGAFDRVLCADCLWMPEQHDNLRKSIAWFLKENDPEARAWVVGGFHSGRAKMRGFFDADKLREVGLEVERLWERDCDGNDREWAWDRGAEDLDVTGRKRWLAVSVLRRIRKDAGSDDDDKAER